MTDPLKMTLDEIAAEIALVQTEPDEFPGITMCKRGFAVSIKFAATGWALRLTHTRTGRYTTYTDADFDRANGVCMIRALRKAQDGGYLAPLAKAKRKQRKRR